MWGVLKGSAAGVHVLGMGSGHSKTKWQNVVVRVRVVCVCACACVRLALVPGPWDNNGPTCYLREEALNVIGDASCRYLWYTAHTVRTLYQSHIQYSR